MATTRGPVPQSTDEIRTHVFDYTDDLLTGVTIDDASAVHAPPSGDALTPTVVVASPLVYVTLGPLAVKGWHTLDCNAEASSGEALNVRLIIRVNR